MIAWQIPFFIWRNPSYVTRNPKGITEGARRAYATVKAMESYRAKARTAGEYLCRFCGRSDDIQIHHIEPVSVAPERAGEESNFLLLCQKDHFRIGHAGNWKDYVKNVDDICRIRDLRVTE